MSQKVEVKVYKNTECVANVSRVPVPRSKVLAVRYQGCYYTLNGTDASRYYILANDPTGLC